MLDKHLRRRVLLNPKTKPPNSPSSSNHKLDRRVKVPGSHKKLLKCFKRCNSEPALFNVDTSIDEEHDEAILLRQACVDALSSSPDLALPCSPPNTKIHHCHAYDKDSRVVMNVTVEGSPGPVRSMIKLGSSVEETMMIVKKQYNSEGRSPRLDQHSISTFELHHSYFSLQCMDTSDIIGDTGRRSFYMRRCNDDISLRESQVISTRTSNSPPSIRIIPFTSSISHGFKMIIRLLSKLWKVLGCVDG